MNKQSTLLLLTCIAGAFPLTSINSQARKATSPKSNQQVKQNPASTLLSERLALGYPFDTTHYKMVSREVSLELPAEKGATIQVNNSICNLDIRPWAEQKVMIVTTVMIEEKQAAVLKTNEEILEAGGISAKSFGNRIDIQAREHAGFDAFSRVDGRFAASEILHLAEEKRALLNKDKHGATTIEPARGKEYVEWNNLLPTQNNYWSTTGKTIKTMVVYVPEASKLDIDNKNTAIIINANIGTANFKLSHSNLDARNFKKLTIIADYYNVNISDVEEAELELENGTFTAGIINALDIDSEGSEIEYESGNSVYMRSQGDRFTIDEIGKVDGRKLYGELRIGKLLTSLDIEGMNADIKIRNINQLVEKIKVNDKYADLRLPVKNLANYTVSFHGENATVFAPFDKIPGPVDPAEKTETTDKVGKTNAKTEKNSKPTVYTESKLTGVPLEIDRAFSPYHTFNGLTTTRGFVGEISPVKFTATVGDVASKHTKFEIVCHQCSVDFK